MEQIDGRSGFMKRHVFALLLAGCICLAGCAQSVPRQAADGGVWDERWVSVGNVIGIDTPEGLTHGIAVS